MIKQSHLKEQMSSTLVYRQFKGQNNTLECEISNVEHSIEQDSQMFIFSF